MRAPPKAIKSYIPLEKLSGSYKLILAGGPAESEEKDSLNIFSGTAPF